MPAHAIYGWLTVITGIIAPPIALFALKKYKLAAVALFAIVASLGIAKIYASLNNWPFPLWLFPLQTITHLTTAHYLYKNKGLIEKSIGHIAFSLKTLFFTFLLCSLLWPLPYFLLSQYAIASVSMNPTLIHGDYVITQKTYDSNAGGLSNLMRSSPLDYGDLVIFKHPKEEETYIKRIIAMPGDNVRFEGNDLSINNTPVERKHIKANKDNPAFRWLKNELYYEINNSKVYNISITSDSAMISGEIKVPEGFYFVMGDNRNQSIDSRFWGLLPKENIMEKPLFIWWSIQPGLKPQIRWKRIAKWLH